MIARLGILLGVLLYPSLLKAEELWYEAEGEVAFLKSLSAFIKNADEGDYRDLLEVNLDVETRRGSLLAGAAITEWMRLDAVGQRAYLVEVLPDLSPPIQSMFINASIDRHPQLTAKWILVLRKFL